MSFSASFLRNTRGILLLITSPFDQGWSGAALSLLGLPAFRQGLLLHFLLNIELEAAKLQLALRGSFTTKEAKGSLTVGQLWETQG